MGQPFAPPVDENTDEQGYGDRRHPDEGAAPGSHTHKPGNCDEGARRSYGGNDRRNSLKRLSQGLAPALIVPTVLMLGFGWTRLEQVVDVSPIPKGFPPFSLPNLDLLTLDLFLGAIALAGITIVQGVGISESIRNYVKSNQSTSTDLNRSTGGRTRWTNLFCSLWLLVFVFLLAGLIELIPMAVLAGLMVYAGIGAMAFGRAKSIFRTGPIPLIVFFTTLVIAVMVSVPAAVILGLILSLVMNMVQASNDFSVREVTVHDDGSLIEGPAPKQLRGNEITLVNLYGDLFFAAAKQLQQ